MNPLIAKGAFDLGVSLIERWFPDKQKQEQAKSEMVMLLADKDFQGVMKQLEINAIEAAHPSTWVSGGRPFFIWISGVGFLYSVVVQPIFVWVARIKGWPEPPSVNTDLLWVVLSGLLGIGTMRSFDKLKGTSK